MCDKGYIIVDLPKDRDRCNGCELLYYSDWEIPVCRYKNKPHPNYLVMADDDDKLCKPDWCPIKEFPKEDNENYFPDEFMDGMATGWNMCLRKIKGKSDEDQI